MKRIGIDLRRAPELVAATGSAIGRPLHVLETTTSTNDEAQRAAREGAPHGATWVAEEQTAGRGRRGRTWTSPPGEGLLFSVLLRVAAAPARIPLVALVAGLAVRDAVARAAGGAAIGVKWPNDVVAGDHKLAGVLVEAVTVGKHVDAVVVGIGINVHTRSFPDEIADRATSVALVSRAASPPDRAELLASVLAGLDHDLHVVVARGLGPVHARLEAADALRGRRVTSDGGEAGVASGIADDGRLRIRMDDGTLRHWVSGEVNLVRR